MSVNLEKTHCSEDPEVQSVTHHDCTVDGVTYRVWSAFLGRKKAEDSLGALMLRQLERGYGTPAVDAKQTESESM